MLIHSKEIVKKWLKNCNAVPRSFYNYNIKPDNQFVTQMLNIKYDKFPYASPIKRQQILMKNMELLQQLIEKSKKDLKILVVYQKEVGIFIQHFSRCISDMKYEELVKTIKMLTKISRYYHQFKRQFLSLFFKALQRKMKEIIIHNQPPLSIEEISSIIHPFLKAKSSMSTSKDILEHITSNMIKVINVDQLTKQQIHQYKKALSIFIPHGVKSTQNMKYDLFLFLDNQYIKKKLPLILEVILLYLEYNTSLSQSPSWLFEYFKKCYKTFIEQNNLNDQVLLLFILVKFSQHKPLAQTLSFKSSQFVDNIIKINTKIVCLLEKSSSQAFDFQSSFKCLEILEKLFVKNLFYVNLINQQIKSLKRKQNIISVDVINIQIIKLAHMVFKKHIKTDYSQIRELIFPFMKIISCQFHELMYKQKNIAMMAYDFILSFVQESCQKQKFLINYLRPLEFLISFQQYVPQTQFKNYVNMLILLKDKANDQQQGRFFQTFQLIRLRLLLTHMKIPINSHCRLEKTYTTIKKSQIATIFQNLDRTRLRELNLPEMIQISQDVVKNKSLNPNDPQADDNSSWSILLSSAKPQEMLLLWRPYLKKHIKFPKFLTFFNACISQQNFQISGLSLQLCAQIHLQCEQRQIYCRTNIQKLLKFSHPYEVLHQFWQYSIHNIKKIYILYHIYQTHKHLKLSEPPTTLFDFYKKQIYFLFNLIQLPQHQFTIDEIIAVLNYYIEERLSLQAQIDPHLIGLYRDLFLWISSNNLTSILIDHLKNFPQSLKSLDIFLKKTCVNQCDNFYDQVSLIKICESLPIEQTTEQNLQTYQYLKNNQNFLKFYDLAIKKLSEDQLQSYQIDDLVKFIFRGIQSPNLDLIYSRLSKFLQKKQQLYYSNNTLNMISKLLYQKFYKGMAMTKNEKKLAQVLINCYKRYFLLQEISFRSQYSIASLHHIINNSFPAQFPLEKFIGANRYTIIELTPIINHFNIKVQGSKIDQLIKYLSFSRFFQFYFGTRSELITKKGIDKFTNLLYLMLANHKFQAIFKLIELTVKDLLKLNPEMRRYFSQKLALWYQITNSIGNQKLQDMLYKLQQIFPKDPLYQQIQRIIAISNGKQNILVQKIQKQHQLIHTKTILQFKGLDIEFYAYKIKQNNFILIRDKSQLIDGVMPCGQDILLSKFLEINLGVKISFLGYCLQSI